MNELSKLRDYFATKAIGGAMAKEIIVRKIDPQLSSEFRTVTVFDPQATARKAYEFADAMLAELARLSKPEGREP